MPERVAWKKGIDLRDDKGYYSYRGRRYPSVTTVLGPHSDFVWVHCQWIAEKVVELVNKNYHGEEVERWDEVVDTLTGEKKWQLVPATAGELLLDPQWLKNEGFRRLKQAADRGSVIHDMLADYARGMEVVSCQLEDYLQESIWEHKRTCKVDECLPYAKSLLAWLDKEQPTIYISESSVFNDDHEYAGTIDAVCGIGEELYCLDIKTSDSFKRTWMAQIAAYSNALFGVIEDEGIQMEWPIPKETKCAILQVLPDRYIWRPMEVHEVKASFERLFLPSLNAYRANQSLPLPARGRTTKTGEKPVHLEVISA